MLILIFEFLKNSEKVFWGSPKDFFTLLLTTLNIFPWWLMYVVKHSFLALYFAVPDKINTFVLCFS